MARRPIKKPDAAHIRQIFVDEAETMHVFDEQHKVWKAGEIDRFFAEDWSFVTLKPPPDASDTLIETIKTKLYGRGARVVHVHAKQKSLTVVASEIYEQKSSIDPRRVVLQMVEESNTRDRDALRIRVEHSLASVGL